MIELPGMNESISGLTFCDVREKFLNHKNNLARHNVRHQVRL